MCFYDFAGDFANTIDRVILKLDNDNNRCNIFRACNI